MERSILSPRTEIFPGKRDFLKSKYRNGFPNGKCAFHLLFFLVPVLLPQMAFDPILRRKVVPGNGTSASPWKFPVRDLTRPIYNIYRPTGFSE